jgi:hypothetical protein
MGHIRNLAICWLIAASLLIAGCGRRVARSGVQAAEGPVLQFPPTPSSAAAQTLQASKVIRRQERRRLPPDPPNIVIILLDDVGFGLPDTFAACFIPPRGQPV